MADGFPHETALLLAPTQTRTVGDLLACGAYVHDRPSLEAAQCEKVVLYQACRDVLPPRVVIDAGRQQHWRADFVSYSGEFLPTGELNRSIGHWNGSSQVEVFQVVSGAATILVGGRSRGEPYLLAAECGAGDLVVVPPGAWHLTYAASRAEVFNIYCGAAEEQDDDRKYSARAPIEVVLVGTREGERTWFVTGDHSGLGVGTWEGVHNRGLLTNVDLVAFHRHAADAELATLAADVWRLVANGWPSVDPQRP